MTKAVYKPRRATGDREEAVSLAKLVDVLLRSLDSLRCLRSEDGEASTIKLREVDLVLHFAAADRTVDSIRWGVDAPLTLRQAIARLSELKQHVYVTPTALLSVPQDQWRQFQMRLRFGDLPTETPAANPPTTV